MAVTRAKANTLLNASEMGLYDDSRANALRGHSAAQLARLVSRSRTARDRARDLEKRQKLALRQRTGSKTGRSGAANARTGEKAELLADILKRFEAQHKDLARRERDALKQASAGKAAAGKTAAKKLAAKKTAASKPAAKKAAGGRKAAKQPVTTKRAAGKTPARKTAATNTTAKKKAAAKQVAKKTAAKKPAPASTRAPAKRASAVKRTPTAPAAGNGAGKADARNAGAKKAAAKTSAARKSAAKPAAGISPKKALANTRKLLAQHNTEAQSPRPWQQIEDGGTALPAPGYQSGQAARKANALHAAESRLVPIQGSISTRDRRNQGKRDHRSSDE